MSQAKFDQLFSHEALAGLMPQGRADEFFDALFGDAGEGAYDIGLEFTGGNETELDFRLILRQRPGKCLSCSLTYGLPEVFSRHPIINVKGLVADICQMTGDNAGQARWKLGQTKQLSAQLHAIPLKITLN